jgi:hypothetical protein
MKNIRKIIPFFLVAAALLQSCSDKLNNAQPSTQVSQETAFSSPNAIRAVRTVMFSYFHNPDYTTIYMLVPEALADDIYNRIGAARLSGPSHNEKGSGVMDIAGNTGQSTYDLSYKIINQANLLIHNIPKGVIPHADSVQYVGEAYFVRAFVYHHLVRTLGYEPGMQPSAGSGSDWDWGVIIRKKPTLKASDATYRPRSTVKQVYALIESDLNKAIDMLGQQSAGRQIYPSKAAAEAELARVYLYAQDYEKANQYATSAIADAAEEVGAEEATPDEVASMFDETKGLNPEGIWIDEIGTTVDMPQGGNLNVSLNVFTATAWLAGVPTQDVLNLYSENDKRLAWFSAPCYDETNGKSVSGCRGTSPYINNGDGKVELDKWNGEKGNHVDDVPYLRVSEQLLIQSEARLKGASGDPLAPINELRKDRGLKPLTTVTMKDVLNARRREFIGEGMRFFDLKRLGKSIHKDPNATGIPPTLPYTSYKVLDNIPNGEVTQSKQNAPKDSVLLQNPGYPGYEGS